MAVGNEVDIEKQLSEKEGKKVHNYIYVTGSGKTRHIARTPKQRNAHF